MNVIQKALVKYKNASVVFKASIWFVLVSVIDNGISVFTQPFVNRILSVEQVGVYNVYSTWATIFRIVATFNLFCGVYEVLLVDHKDDQDQVSGSLCVLSTASTVVFFLVIFLLINPISSALKLNPLYFGLMFFFVLSEEIIQFYIVRLRFNYKYIRYSVFVVSLFFIKSVLTVLLAYLIASDRIMGRILGLTAPMFAVAIVLFILIVKNTSIAHITKYWKKGVVFNIPLIPHYLSSILLSSSDKLMLQHFTNDYDVGLYSVVYSFSGLSLIVFTAINNSYTPWAYTALKEKQYDQLKKRTNNILLASVLFCVLLMLFAPEGVFLLGGRAYLQALPIVPVLICGIFFSSFYFIFANVEFINKKTKMVFPITLLGTVMNIGLNWWLIPKIGYQAAAYTTLLGYIAIAVCHYVYSKIIAKERIYDIKGISLILLCLAVITVGCVFLYRLSAWVRYLLIPLFGVVFVLVLRLLFKKRKDKADDKNTDDVSPAQSGEDEVVGDDS